MTQVLKALATAVFALDHAVASMVCDCLDGGRSWCDWTTRMHHHYIELRASWHDAGGRPEDLPAPLQLDADGCLLVAAEVARGPA